MDETYHKLEDKEMEEIEETDKMETDMEVKEDKEEEEKKEEKPEKEIKKDRKPRSPDENHPYVLLNTVKPGNHGGNVYLSILESTIRTEKKKDGNDI